MEFLPTEIADVMLVRPVVHGDERGYFLEFWHAGKFAGAGIDVSFVQDNESRSAKGTLRGLHYQIRQPQGKLVRVVEGSVYDVAVDMRRRSPTFGRWVGRELDSNGKEMLWVPPGFAHGFYVTSETAVLAYKCTDLYAPEHERSVLWNDPGLAIAWPIPRGATPLLSAKDAAAPAFADADCYP